MKTREYLKTFFSVYCYVASVCLLVAALISGAATAVSSRQELMNDPVIVIGAAVDSSVAGVNDDHRIVHQLLPAADRCGGT